MTSGRARKPKRPPIRPDNSKKRWRKLKRKRKRTRAGRGAPTGAVAVTRVRPAASAPGRAP
jgi:hypothetical protein